MSLFFPAANLALISIVAFLTGKQIKIEEDKTGSIIRDSEGNIIARIPKTQDEPLTFMSVFFKRIHNITATKQADSLIPDYSYKSQDVDVSLSRIALVPDSNFKTHGMIAININKSILLPPTSAGDFTDLTAFTLPLRQEGIKLRRGETLDIWVWTDDGTNCAITLTASVAKQVQIGQN